MKTKAKLMLSALALLTILGVNQAHAEEEQQKVVLITGTASGIGKATAEYLLSEGHIVYGGDIQFEKNKYLDAIGGHSLDMDVTNDSMIHAGVERIMKEQSRIDVLVNNAGYGLYGPVEDITMEDAQAQFDVNLFGLAKVTKAVLPHMRAQQSGRIINISSMGGKVSTPLGAWYHATKYAVEGFSDCLRLELDAHNIKVVIIEPGAINTNFGNVAMVHLEKYSNNPAYDHMTKPYLRMFEQMRDSTSSVQGSEPIVIAKVISKAIDKKNPRTRYVKGRMAKLAIWYKNTLGDKAYDRLIMRTMKRMEKRMLKESAEIQS